MRSSTRHATVVLYRPVGQQELDQIRATGFRAFPPRRASSDPVIYPVLDEAYAVQIAREWNTKDARCGFAGFVTRFHVREDFLAGYPVQVVGPQRHREFWIPAEEIDELNGAIVGAIEVLHAFRGDGPLRAGEGRR